MKKILIITNIPSYHQVDLFNEIANIKEVEICVFYLLKKTTDRHWTKEFKISHPHEFIKYTNISVKRGVYFNAEIFKHINKFNPSEIILTQYANITQQLILYYYWIFKKKINLYFWSEKPGIPFYEVPILKSSTLRVLFRKISLYPILKNKNIRIWGVGKKAVKYFENKKNSNVENLPYFLKTKRFLNNKQRTYNSRINVLFAGKLNYRKGVDIIIDFLEKTEKEFLNNFNFTIIGTGDYLKKIEIISKNYPNVSYLGFVERQEMPIYYQTHDLFLFPGRYDGWGMVINESMASGLIVLASNNIGAVEDCIINEENGLKIEPTIESLKSNLTWILNNKDKLKTISKNAIKKSYENDSILGSKKFVDLIK